MSNRWIWALGVLLVLAAVAVFFRFQPRPLESGAGTRVLVLGLDQVEGRSRSDTIIVAQADDQGVSLLSVPRDLRVKFPDGGLRKVNAAYSLGGVAEARQVISNFLGLSLPYYLVVDYAGFKTVVDLLGGVEVEVEKRMDYDDASQDLHIHLAPGPQMLDGEKALEYVRYRGASGDLGRIRRQQKLLQAILDKQGVQLTTFGAVKSLLEMAFKHVKETNLLLPDLLGLARRLQGLKATQVTMQQLPGQPVNEGGQSYLDPYIVRTAALVERSFRHRPVLLRSEVRVVVLNGNGASGLAGSVEARLKGRDFQVIEVGNAENFDYLNTLVVSLGQDPTPAQWVFEALGGVGQQVTAEAVADHLQAIRACGQPCRIDDPTTLERADVVVIAGQDFSPDGR